MKPLIDGDIFLHEIGWSSEFYDKETHKNVVLDFDRAVGLFEDKIHVILMEVGATEEPEFFFTNSQWLTDSYNRENKFSGVGALTFEPNFRESIAVSKPYKGTRKNPKPYHFYNLLSYIRSAYPHTISQNGLEADDEICIRQIEAIEKGEETIIVSRDKDLRICPGNHYSWECGNQRAVGPTHTDRLGRLEKNKSGKTVGYGILFFYYQMLVGDTADNIPGLPGCGDVRATRILDSVTSEYEAFDKVRQEYIRVVGPDMAKSYFLEQANLLWMIQERGKKYEFPRKDHS